ncbi:hypothetical protein M569_17588, partial [Genlisea aurea]
MWQQKEYAGYLSGDWRNTNYESNDQASHILQELQNLLPQQFSPTKQQFVQEQQTYMPQQYQQQEVEQPKEVSAPMEVITEKFDEREVDVTTEKRKSDAVMTYMNETFEEAEEETLVAAAEEILTGSQNELEEGRDWTEKVTTGIIEEKSEMKVAELESRIEEQFSLDEKVLQEPAPEKKEVKEVHLKEILALRVKEPIDEQLKTEVVQCTIFGDGRHSSNVGVTYRIHVHTEDDLL